MLLNLKLVEASIVAYLASSELLYSSAKLTPSWDSMPGVETSSIQVAGFRPS